MCFRNPAGGGVLRRLTGFVAAIACVPLAIVVAFAVLAVAGVGMAPGRDWRDWVGSAVIFSIYAVPIALAMGVVVGLPGALIMESAGVASARAFATLGGFAGVAPFVVFDLIVVAYRPREFDAWRQAVLWAALGAWCGVWAALVYWRIALRPPR